MSNKNYYDDFIDTKIRQYYIKNKIKISDSAFTSLKGHFKLDGGVSDPRVQTDMYKDLIKLRKTIQTKYPGGDFVISSAKRSSRNPTGHDYGLGVDIKPTGNITWTQLYDTIYDDYKDVFHPVLHNNMTPGQKNVTVYNPSKFNKPYSSSDKVHIDLKYNLYNRVHNKTSNNKMNNHGTSNSANYGNSVRQDTNPRVSQTTTIPRVKKPSFMKTLSNIINALAGDSINLGNLASVPDSSRYHSGGKIPGSREVMAILQGGETVRTEGQEAAIQEEISKLRIASIEKRNLQSDEIQHKRLIGEMLYTKNMKNFIINTIIEAYNYNQCGFRRLIG